MVPVEFILGHRCEFGQRFAIVGGDDALGAWDVARARPLEVGAVGGGEMGAGPGRARGLGRGAHAPAGGVRRAVPLASGSVLRPAPAALPAFRALPQPSTPFNPSCHAPLLRNPQWHDGDVWSAVLALPANRTIDFKPVIVADADGAVIAWCGDRRGGLPCFGGLSHGPLPGTAACLEVSGCALLPFLTAEPSLAELSLPTSSPQGRRRRRRRGPQPARDRQGGQRGRRRRARGAAARGVE
jgi:hypothetical protein